MYRRVASLALIAVLAGCDEKAGDANTAEPLLAEQTNSGSVVGSDNVILVSPSELNRAFARDAKLASARYYGRVVSVTGDVVRVVRMDGFVDATLYGGGAGEIEVSIEDTEDDAGRVTNGQTISVACSVIDDFETPILLRGCDGLAILDKD